MIFKSKLIKGLLIVAILVTAVKQILLTQVIYALSTGSIALSNSSGGNMSIGILPTDKDEDRGYKWKEEPVTLSKYVATNGKQMVEMEKEINDSSLTPEQKKRLDAFGLLPHLCCNAPINTKDCLHAVAAMGLAKFLITQGWDDKKIKEELFLWYRYWWPKHYAIVSTYLQSKGADPKSVSVDDWMSDRLSTISIEQSMMNELGGEK
ncbi:MAG: hypothetical protein AAB441_01300 [Patescibacteria group bacterium]